MRVVTLLAEDDFDGWRDAARSLARARVPPSELLWQAGGAPQDLFGDEAAMETPDAVPFPVPRAFLDLARNAICHADPERFALLYALLARLRGRSPRDGGRGRSAASPAQAMAKEVRRDMHKMRAFLRFREVEDGEGPRYVAWFEPDAPYRPRQCRLLRPPLRLDALVDPDPRALDPLGRRDALRGPGAAKADAPAGDPVEEVWKTYYASIFNPARVKTGAMLKEMPSKYWKNMPETALVPELVKGAQARESAMVAASAAKLGDNAEKSWEAVRAEAMRCTRCHLYKCATQTVFGEGPLDARILFVGEQPGDQEDLAGRPFVGPAGQLFDRALADAGVDRGTHLRHQRGQAFQVRAARQAPHPRQARRRRDRRLPLVARAGAGAGPAAAHRRARRHRGALLVRQGGDDLQPARPRPRACPTAGEAWVTVHPSFLLRVRDDKEAEYARFVEDLERIGKRAKALA